MNETIKRIDDQAKLVFKKKSYGYEAKEVRLPSDKYNMLIELAMKLQDENETLSAANNDLLHEIRVLKNQMNDQTNLRLLEFEVQNKQLLKQNKSYRSTMKKSIEYLDEIAKTSESSSYIYQVITDFIQVLESESHE